MNRYIPPRIVKGAVWYLVWYTWDLITNDYVRHRRTFQLNRIPNKRDRLRRAKILKQEISYKLERGLPVLEDPNKPLYSTSVQDALEKAARQKCEGARPATQRTFKNQSEILIRYLQRIGQHNMPVSMWDKGCALAFLDEVATNVSGRTYNNYVNVFRILFNYLLERKYIQTNPFVGIPKAKEDRKRRKCFSGQDAMVVAAEARNTDPPLYLGILLQYHCFIRPTELARLRVQDIDLIDGLIRLDGDQTKNRRSDIVTIPDVIIPSVRDYLKGIPGKWRLFGHGGKPGPTGPAGRNTMNTRHRKLLVDLHKRGKISTIEGLSYYSWKDTGATALVRAGIPIDEVMKQLRHSDLSTTQIYIQSLHRVNENIRKLDSFLI